MNHSYHFSSHPVFEYQTFNFQPPRAHIQNIFKEAADDNFFKDKIECHLKRFSIE
jgi:hypothetical protein